MLVDQVCEATGGACTYSGRDMKETHAGMGVTAGEFDALVEDLVATLDGFDVPRAEREELLGLLAPMRNDIVEVESPQTGTALPDTYRPAPALRCNAEVRETARDLALLNRRLTHVPASGVPAWRLVGSRGTRGSQASRCGPDAGAGH